MPRRGRQGRSHETRNRLKTERSVSKRIQDSLRIEIECHYCGCQDLVEDTNVGEIICVGCGYVQPGAGLMNVLNDIPPAIVYSKPYDRKNHFEQRIKQLRLTDARVSKKVTMKIYKHCQTRGIDIEQLNKKGMSVICRRLGLSEKIPNHYLQIKSRLGYLNNYYLDDMDVALWENLRMRFRMVSTRFNEMKANREITRENIININLIILELVRLEDEEFVQYFEPHLPQLKPKKRNNDMEILKRIFSTLPDACYDRKKEQGFIFNWV